jgi:hypothetical protein
MKRSLKCEMTLGGNNGHEDKNQTCADYADSAP